MIYNADMHLLQISNTYFFHWFQGESFYNPYIPQTLDLLRQSNLIEENEGAQVIFTEGKPNPLIVVKSDGGFNYASTDLAALWLVLFIFVYFLIFHSNQVFKYVARYHMKV